KVDSRIDVLAYALRVCDIERAAIRADGKRSGIPPRGNSPQKCGVKWIRYIHNCNRLNAGFRHKQLRSIRREPEGIRISTLSKRHPTAGVVGERKERRTQIKVGHEMLARLQNNARQAVVIRVRDK